MAAIGARDVAVAGGVRTIDNFQLPGYYKEIRIGSGHTPNGCAFEVTGGVLYIDNIFGGAGYFQNNYYEGNGLLGFSIRNQEAVMGIAQNTALSGAASHGVRGQNQTLGTSGLVGVANGYDFYADGSGTNYGPFTGTHDALMRPLDALGAQMGDVVMDVECLYRRDISNTLFRVELARSAGPNPRAALGVICAKKTWTENHLIAALQDALDFVELDVPDGKGGKQRIQKTIPRNSNTYESLRTVGYKLLAVNAVGEGMINVCGMGGDIAQDDLLVVSNRAGKAMKQSDKVVYSYTVARAREGCTFQKPTDVKTISCIYVSG